MIDFQNRRAIVVDGHADKTIMTLTTVQDLAAVVAKAVEAKDVGDGRGGVRGGKSTVFAA